ncbi:Na(+) H(+) antiporter subunit C [Methylophaga frappieri]|uniref:Na(+) H(+) antiporter subunit C n=1 Tax=Methylophaga frappieri (strain ATCC BAA-2434 / DSM 25690 / JAM7) TaxID=754477 RepID=I1YH76_METFJ|nr:Na+/H+ antiporter subunit C [Methylophaga frappieri]AFJ02269.1 Na(+) H(+) antiporter subunit C [Methylophaga frappieri]
MEWLIAAMIAVMTSSGVFLVLRARTFPVVLGLTLLAYAVNVFLFAMGRLQIGTPPVIDKSALAYTDPLPQALVLTAIVIAFGMTAFLIVLALKSRSELGNDHVDGVHKSVDEREASRQQADMGEHP